ncbi:MAG: hypothetical protein OEW67_07010 [Cyclobacteriaceae bacterium]|nr:hypothetical protein [Cyclobacteriaceae bacterium]
MKKLNYLLYFSVLLLIFPSCGGKESKNEGTEEMIEEINEVIEENKKESPDFENMSCADFLEAYEEYMNGYKELAEKYKDVDNNDYAAAIRASNDMMELAKEHGEWAKTSGDFLIKCVQEEGFVEKMEQIQEKFDNNN